MVLELFGGKDDWDEDGFAAIPQHGTSKLKGVKLIPRDPMGWVYASEPRWGFSAPSEKGGTEITLDALAKTEEVFGN